LLNNAQRSERSLPQITPFLAALLYAKSCQSVYRNYANKSLYAAFWTIGIWKATKHQSSHQAKKTDTLTLILLTWRIWWAPNNASRWQMGFNWAFKGFNVLLKERREIREDEVEDVSSYRMALTKRENNVSWEWKDIPNFWEFAFWKAMEKYLVLSTFIIYGEYETSRWIN